MNERDMARKIASHLDNGLSLVKQGTLNQLRAAREEALSHYHARQPLFGLAWAGHFPLGRGWHGYRFWLPAIMLILALSGIAYWQYAQQNGETEEIDAALLAGDLPLHAYLDKDFDTWLESSSQ